jgi:pimeloyl-ACP methyl ester carboxylesterase
LADALDVDRFAVAGWSGGGPHALAIAHVLGARVSKVALASSLAARLPDCSSHVWAGGGHYAVFAHREEFVGSLR